MPGTYRCGFFILIKSLWSVPYLLLVDQTWSKFFGNLVIDDDELAEEQEVLLREDD